jgi:D-alanyl-D-alanine carboxypeptidase
LVAIFNAIVRERQQPIFFLSSFNKQDMIQFYKSKWSFILITLFFFTACNSGKQSTKDNQDEQKDSTQLTTKEDTTKAFDIDTLVKDPTVTEDEKKKIEDIINKQYLMGKFNPATDPRFIKIPAQYLVYSDREVYMRQEAYESFLKMQDAAAQDGVPLKIMSATRPFNIQKMIWERKWKGRQKVNGKFVPQDAPAKDKAVQILEWNSMPSTSRHHWGTDIDINSVDPINWDKEPGATHYKWLVEHANEYGFCQVYSAGRPYGYQEEKWHWSYIPLARKFTEEYRQKITDMDIEGFEGAEAAPDIEVVKKYVLGINPECL